MTTSNFLRWAAVGAVGIFAACAPVSQLPTVDPAAAKAEREKQEALALRQQVDQRRRLHRIAYSILAASAELCLEQEATRGGHGLLVADENSFGETRAAASRAALHLGTAPRVIEVAAPSAAAAAGFRRDDEIASIDGWKPPKAHAAKAVAEKLAERAKESPGRPVQVVVRRDGREETLSLAQQTICVYTYGVETTDDVNAYADGKRIVVTTGMMRFVENDDELATVVGHEIGHNLMGHIDKKLGNQLIGTVFDLLLAGVGVNTGGAFGNMTGSAYSQEFEAEADYVGLYLMARAGYDIKGSPDLWRKMGMAHPGSIQARAAASHPSTPERFLALESTVREIEGKRAAGKPLRPERAKEPPVGPVPAPDASTSN